MFRGFYEKFEVKHQPADFSKNYNFAIRLQLHSGWQIFPPPSPRKHTQILEGGGYLRKYFPRLRWNVCIEGLDTTCAPVMNITLRPRHKSDRGIGDKHPEAVAAVEEVAASPQDSCWSRDPQLSRRRREQQVQTRQSSEQLRTEKTPCS